MLRLSCQIEIRSERLWRLDTATSVEVDRSMDHLTDTCRITLPRNLRWEGQARVPLHRGDAVTVRLGYDGRLSTAFEGYLLHVSHTNPLQLECQDHMYRLKLQQARPMAYTDATLERILSDQQPGCPVSVVGEQHIGPWRVTQDTVAQALDALRRRGVRCFMHGGTLVAGVLLDHTTGHQVVARTGCNIASRQGLREQSADDMLLRIRAINLDHQGHRTTVEVGDQGGETRTLYTTGKTQDQLRQWALAQERRLRRDGLAGSLTLLGEPLVDKMDTICINLEGRRWGRYQVQSNRISWGPRGYRQEVELGLRLAD